MPSISPKKRLPAVDPAASATNAPLGLADLWHRRVVEIVALGQRHLHDRKLPGAKRIQKARQATKAARALLRLAPPGLKRQARGLAMALSGARRQLGALRDRDAMAETLLAVGAEAGLTRRRMQPLLKPLPAHAAGPSPAHSDDIAQADSTFKRVLAQLKTWKVPRSRDRAIIALVEKDHRRLKRDARPGLGRLDIEDLHALRKRAITHRHQMALLGLFAAGSSGKIDRRVEAARQLHEAIGDHRDRHLLGEYLRALSDPKTHGLRQSLLEIVEKSLEIRLKTAIRLEKRLDRVKPRKAVKAARQRLG